MAAATLAENFDSDAHDEIQIKTFGSFENCQLVGVDEAGRGPVLGPLVYCAFACPKSADLSECKDSKVLTPDERSAICDRLLSETNDFGIVLAYLSPNLISRSMLRLSEPSVNLNELSHRTVERMLSILGEGQSHEVFVDTVGPWKKYQTRLESRFPSKKIVVREKADSLFPPVSAASILAKVCRDNCIRDLGVSGYTSDSKTIKFLKLRILDEVFGFERNLVRFSWSTAAALMESCPKIEWPAAAVVVDKRKRTRDIRSMLSGLVTRDFYQITGLSLLV